nr:MAG TPA: hypothetical protein [Caudoviricetes sp.]
MSIKRNYLLIQYTIILPFVSSYVNTKMVF